MPVGRGKPPVRHRAAYNAHVARDRLEKFYERKKVHHRYARLQKYEHGQQQQVLSSSQGAAKAASLMERIMSEGADAVEAEYERRLDLGSGASSNAEPGGVKRRKKGVKRPAEAEAEGDSHEVPAAAAAGRGRRKKCKPDAEAAPAGNDGGAAAIAGATAGQPAATGVPTLAPKKGKTRTAEEEPAERTAVPVAAKGTLRAAAPEKPTGRFAKEMWTYQLGVAEQASERQRKEEEYRQHKRRRRESAKGRAVKGKQIAQRNRRGQPNLMNILEAVTAKLGCK